MRNKLQVLFSLFIALVLVPGVVFSASTAGLVSGIWFENLEITDFGETQVYSVIHNQIDGTLKGIVTLVVDGEAVKAQDISVLKGAIKKVGIPYTFTVGTHTVSMNFTAETGTESTLTELSTVTIEVVKDTDGDGIKDSIDTDDDNDGIADNADDNPLVKAKIEKSYNLTDIKSSFFSKLEKPTNFKDNFQKQKENSTILKTFENIEAARIGALVALNEYEKKQREEIDKFKKVQESTATSTTVAGFKIIDDGGYDKNDSKKREYQIAAASAATVSFLLDKKWLFYLEMLVLLLGTLHLIFIGIRGKRSYNLNEDEI